jgi:quercetin dioxygenase-like cupin family protein
MDPAAPAPLPSPPLAWAADAGRTFHQGVPFTVKVGELRAGRGFAVMEYATRQGEEPPDHVHPTEDEFFYVLSGTLVFRCGGRSFGLGPGGCILLPQGIEHGYTITSPDPVRLLVVTSPPRPAGGWGGFVAELEQQSERLPAPTNHLFTAP